MTVVFVIGAGASVDYGLPVGPKLVRLITGVGDLNAHEKNLHENIMRQDGQYGPMWWTLEHTPAQTASLLAATLLDSVDRFAAIHESHAPTVRFLISRLLAPMEASALGSRRALDHWHRWFVNQLLVAFDESGQLRLALLDGSLPDLRVISFNYDRLFEYALMSHLLAARPEMNVEQAAKRIAELGVIHIYGMLDRQPSWDQETGTLTVPNEASDIMSASNGLRLIHEERETNQDQWDSARAYLEQADAVVFLGFGFDEMNCARLGLKQDSLLKAREYRSVWATGYGLADRERNRVLDVLRIGQNQAQGTVGLRNQGCEAFLRTHLDAVRLRLRPPG